MTLLSENRNRLPLVATLPVTGEDGGIRGQQRMTTDETDVTGVQVATCTVSDGGIPSTLAVAMATGTMTYTSVAIGDPSALVSVEHAVGGVPVPVVTVVGNAIVVTGDITTTAAQILSAIAGSVAASALVTVANNAGDTLVAVATANLTGGERTFATVTVDTDLVLTAKKAGSAANGLLIIQANIPSLSLPRVKFAGNVITIEGNQGVATTLEIQDAITAHAGVSKLIIATGGTALNFLTENLTGINLAGGSATTVWA